MLRKEFLILLLTTLTLSAASPSAQKDSFQKSRDAIKRSEAATEVVIKLPQLPETGIPKELMAKSEAIGIFPCKKTDLLIEHMVLCHGMISRRLPTGWSLPAFYSFGAGGLGRPDSAVDGASAVVLLFMNEESVSWLKGGFELKGQKKATAGQMGAINEGERSELVKAPLIAYVYLKGVLVGRKLSGGTFRGFGIGPDNDLNRAVYGTKGPGVLTAKEISSPVPREISAFQDALQKYYSR